MGDSLHFSYPKNGTQVPGLSDSSSGSSQARQERQLLEAADIERAVTRMAYEILEANKGPEDLILLGIASRGYPLARRLGEKIIASHPDQNLESLVGQIDVTMYRDDLTSAGFREPRPTFVPPSGIDARTVVLVDDVLYSGRTVRAALDAITELGRPCAVRLAVLVDRGHRELPIRADHVGRNLPTAQSERVTVRLKEFQEDGYDAVSIIQNLSAEGEAKA